MAKPIEQTEVKGEIAGAYMAAGDVEAANKALNDCIDRLRRQFKNPKEYDKHLHAFFEGMHKSDPDDIHLSKDHMGNFLIFCDDIAASLAYRAQKALDNGTMPVNMVAPALNEALESEGPQGRRDVIKQDLVKDFNRRAEQIHQAHKGSGKVEYRASINKEGKIEVNPIYYV
jgi:hypothetical protein